MKKTPRKLVLAKETIRKLAAGDLLDVAAGTAITRNGVTYGSCGEWACDPQPLEASC